MARPTLLLLDEPSLGLAPQGRRADHGRAAPAARRAPADRPAGRAERAQRAVGRRPGVVLNLGRVVARRGRRATLAADDGLRHAYLGFCGPQPASSTSTLNGIVHGAIYAGVALGAGADLARHPGGELRPGRDGDGHHVRRARACIDAGGSYWLGFAVALVAGSCSALSSNGC